MSTDLRTATEHALESTRRAYGARPLAFGAAALLGGVGLGLVLESTRRERRILGPTSDRLVREARRAVRARTDRLVDDLVDDLVRRR